MDGFTSFNDRNNTQQNYVNSLVAAGYDAASAAAHWNYFNTYQLIDGGKRYLLPWPGPMELSGANGANVPTAVTAAPAPPHLRVIFDTIGQVIFRSIGHCRLPLRTIWAQGINESGDVSISNTQTFAAALCAPIDPLEDGEIFAIWDGGSVIFNSSGPVTPIGWTPADAALLATSLANIVIYPGDEAQLPAALIVADKGASKTNAFRGIRYIIFIDYPINGGGRGGGGGLPTLSVGWQRTNDGVTPTDNDDSAVEFFDGAG